MVQVSPSWQPSIVAGPYGVTAVAREKAGAGARSPQARAKEPQIRKVERGRIIRETPRAIERRFRKIWIEDSREQFCHRLQFQ